MNRIFLKAKEFTASIVNFYNSKIRILPTWAKTIFWTPIVSIALFLTLYTMVWIGVFGKIPSKSELRLINNPVASEVYDDEGKLYGKYYIENRTNASFDDIAPSVAQALISTEDERFYKHSGVDFVSWGRVVFKTILSQNKGSGGGSTISQQLAKNLYGRKNYWIFSIVINKLREIAIARKLEDVFTKEEILTLYLNTVSFGSDVYGIRLASRRFFSTTPGLLTIGESATLIGMLKATSYYNPLKNPEKSKERRNTVLKRMLSNGYISDSTCQMASNEPLQVKHTIDPATLGIALHFREHLKSEMEHLLKDHKKPNGTPYNIYIDGLKIYTSIDQKLQKDAESTVKEHMAFMQKEFDHVWAGKDPWPDEKYILDQIKKTDRYIKLKQAGASDEMINKSFNTTINCKLYDIEKDSIIDKIITPLDSLKHYCRMLRSGLICTELKTGLVKAWVGGYNYNAIKFDHVKAKRQAGSIFKPIVYGQALRIGMDPCKYYLNQIKTYHQWDDWRPENVDKSSGGSYNMPQALAKSVNLVTVDIAMQAGLPEIKQLANDMGIEQRIYAVPAIALGSVDANLVDMSRVYGTIANRGLKYQVHCIKRIEDKYGNILYDVDLENKPQTQVLTEEVCDILIKMLERVVDHGTASTIRRTFGLKGDIAGKTGTSQDNADGWFMGFTRGFLTGVWVGAESPVIKYKYGTLGQGANSALPIWAKFNHKLSINSKYGPQTDDYKFVEPNDTIKSNYDCIFSFYRHQDDEIPDSLGFSDTMRIFSNPILEEMKTKKLKDSINKNK